MSLLNLARLITFGSAVVFSVVVIGLSADIVNTTNKFNEFYFTWSALAIATSAITLASVVPMFVIDITRRGAFTSFIVVEIAWLTVIWVLWLATAAQAVDTNTIYFGTGSCNFIDSDVARICKEWDAIEAMAFLAWLVVMAYSIALIVMASIAHTRGQKAWLTSVRDGFGPVPEKPIGTGAPMQPVQQVPVVQGTPYGSPAPQAPYGSPAPQTPYYPQQATMNVTRAEV